MALETAAVSILASALKKPLEDLYQAASGEAKRRLKAIQTDVKVRQLAKSIGAVQKVKVLWNISKEVKLLTFYYPSKVIVAGLPKPVASVQEIQETGSFVIEGTVGQGKSIFLRYLCIQELASSKRVPVFVELRRYEAGRSFSQFLSDCLGVLGLPSDAETFDYLAQSGKLVLLLDGFDELELDSVTRVLNDLENLVQRYPELQVVVTSRPDSGIEKSPHFRVHRLAPLQPSDHKPFLEKVVPDAAKRALIIRAISESNAQIKQLLTTPLLLTLLVIVYNSTQNIPPTLSAFYEELFQTLLLRHDNSKPGFRRKRFSKLSDSDLKRLFEAFCYGARQQNTLVLSNSAFEKLTTRACDVLGLQCPPEDFAKDICRVACLMQQEGLNYQFIHKSVAEFHAACFIAHSSTENAQRFYTKVVSEKWRQWGQELKFLGEIDRHRYLEYFLLPATADGFSDLGLGKPTDFDSATCNDGWIANFLNRYIIVVEEEKPPPGTSASELDVLDLYIRVPPRQTYLLAAIQGDFFDEIVDILIPPESHPQRAHRRKPRHRLNEGAIPANSPPHPLRELFRGTGSSGLPLGDALSRLGLLPSAAQIVRAVLDRSRHRYEANLAELSRDKKVAEFVDP